MTALSESEGLGVGGGWAPQIENAFISSRFNDKPLYAFEFLSFFAAVKPKVIYTPLPNFVQNQTFESTVCLLLKSSVWIVDG